MKKPEKWKPKEDEICYRIVCDDKCDFNTTTMRYWGAVYKGTKGIFETKKQAQAAIKKIKEVLRNG